MWIQVRSMDGKKSHRIDGLSKLSKIEYLRDQLKENFEASVDRIRLFYRGKQLEDGYTLFDYDVGLNDIVQVLVKPDMTLKPSEEKNSDENKQSPNVIVKEDADKENQCKAGASSITESSDHEERASSKYYKVGDLVDAKDLDSGLGAWFEAKIVDIKKKSLVLDTKPEFNDCVQNGDKESTDSSGSVTDDGLEYYATFEGYEKADPTKLLLKDFRPRARRIIKFDDIKENSMVMVNYNIDEPKMRGYWYDGVVTAIKKSRTVNELIVKIFIGNDRVPVENCNIIFVKEVFAVEKHKLLHEQAESTGCENAVIRQTKVKCPHCKDVPDKRCKYCSCHVCGGKEEPEKQILCDECDLPFHIGCLKPPLTEIPDVEEWYCPICKNDENEVVKAGEKLKESKKKAKMASASSSCKRDWGSGMACTGRTKECTIVPPNHFGPIPGVEVGTLWKYRVQVSESGVHRPHVAGIHGRESDGAFSIVLSGGYEDDVDDGEEFKYTGSGGRDLSGNKRTAEQSSDQKLTRMNRALAVNCAAPINSKLGAEAKNWKEGKPVRVVRNCKGRKHSTYCPEDGNRYDGIYKVVKYWPEKGKSGYLVWRYMLRRDDPVPAPWTKTGKRRTKELGLTMQYPEGYVENTEKASKGSAKKTKGKRPKEDEEKEEVDSPKKLKSAVYQIPHDVEKLIKEDKNQKLWEECIKCVAGGSKAFLQKVEETFLCICCQEVVYRPVTTECLHNVCKSCLSRSFKAGVYSCPMCRHDMGKDYSLDINKPLQEILQKLFPGYAAGR